jgi:hypothetical protein
MLYLGPAKLRGCRLAHAGELLARRRRILLASGRHELLGEVEGLTVHPSKIAVVIAASELSWMVSIQA